MAGRHRRRHEALGAQLAACWTASTGRASILRVSVARRLFDDKKISRINDHACRSAQNMVVSALHGNCGKRPADTLEAAHALLLAERAKAAAADARHRDATQLLEAQRLELERLQAEQRELEAQVAEIQARNQRYEHILATLKRLQFGRSSERLDKDQLNLAFEDLVQGLAEIEQAEERADPALKTHGLASGATSGPRFPIIWLRLRWCWSRSRPSVPAARAPCIRSGRTSPGGSMWCQRSTR